MLKLAPPLPITPPLHITPPLPIAPALPTAPALPSAVGPRVLLPLLPPQLLPLLSPPLNLQRPVGRFLRFLRLGPCRLLRLLLLPRKTRSAVVF